MSADAQTAVSMDRSAKVTIHAADAVIVDADTVLCPGWIRVQGERIESVGAGAPPADFPIDRRAPGVVLMPGLVCAHAHLAFGELRHLSHDAEFIPWMVEGVQPAVARAAADPLLWERGALRSARELRSGGVTFVADSFFRADGVCALRAVGLDGCFFQEVFGFAVADDLAYLARETERWQDLPDALGGFPFGYSPHTPWSCPPEVFRAVVRRARAEGRRVATHLAESVEEEECFRFGRGPLAELRARLPAPERYPTGCSPTEHLANLGVLGPDVLVAHGVQLTEADLTILAHFEVPVVHCPTSNMKLAEGIAPVAEMLERGLVVALGTDSVASTGRLDLFAEMRLALLAQRARRRRVRGLDARLAFRMATEHGARALGVESERGRLIQGAYADFACVDLLDAIGGAIDRCIEALVWSASPDLVREVWVRGARVWPEAQDG